MSIVVLPGGICFAHGPYEKTVGCPKWPACATDPQQPEYIALAESRKPMPHVCPPLSPELRRRIEAEIEHRKGNNHVRRTLEWVLRESAEASQVDMTAMLRRAESAESRLAQAGKLAEAVRESAEKCPSVVCRKRLRTALSDFDKP